MEPLVMRWKTGRRSSNIEDRRGQRRRVGTFKGGIGTIVIALALAYFLGIDPQVLLQMQQGVAPVATQEGRAPTPQEQQLAEFVSVVLADTEDTWNAIFEGSGLDYQEPVLVMFSGSVQSACGMASGPETAARCPR
jgi:predicted metalloprotease